MSEYLVREKSKAQRRVEAVLCYIVPPLVGLGFWLTLPGGGLGAPLAVLFAFFAIGPIGNLFAARFGKGEMVTREERLRRILARMGKSFWRAAASMSVLLAILYVSAFLPMVTPEELRAGWPWIVGGSLILSVISGISCAISLKTMARGLDATQPVAAPQTLWRWAIGYLPTIYLFWAAGLAAGYFAGLHLSQPLAFACPGAGLLLGTMAFAVVRGRRPKPPMLWHRFNFWQALLISMLQMGMMFAGMIFAQTRLMGMDLAGNFMMAGIAMAFGTIFMMVFWALAKVNDVRARRKG